MVERRPPSERADSDAGASVVTAVVIGMAALASVIRRWNEGVRLSEHTHNQRDGVAELE